MVANLYFSHEVNLSVHKCGLTIYRRFHPGPEGHSLSVKGETRISTSSDHSKLLLAGSAVRFFHKELEAYLTAEGRLDGQISKDGVNHLVQCLDYLYIRKIIWVMRTTAPTNASILLFQFITELDLLITATQRPCFHRIPLLYIGRLRAETTWWLFLKMSFKVC